MPEVPPNPSDVPPSATAQGDRAQVKERHQQLSDQHQESRKPTAQEFISKGPVIPEEMPPKASREEIEARKKELNK
ncbi:hypothetical protein VTN02DRAFT_950 [Thermoascus thermophilus]